MKHLSQQLVKQGKSLYFKDTIAQRFLQSRARLLQDQQDAQSNSGLEQPQKSRQTLNNTYFKSILDESTKAYGVVGYQPKTKLGQKQEMNVIQGIKQNFQEDTSELNDIISNNERFQPGNTYKPEDLNPLKVSRPQWMIRKEPDAEKISMKEFRKRAHVTNLPYMVQFLTDTGKVLPKEATNLETDAQNRMFKYIQRMRSMSMIPKNIRPVEILGSDHPYLNPTKGRAKSIMDTKSEWWKTH